MSLLQGALGMGRRQKESRFTETLEAFTVASVEGEDGVFADVETSLYTGVPGQVKYPTFTVSERPQGGQVPAVQDIEIHVAVGATPNVAVNTRWRVTASTVDVSLVGRVYRTKGEAQSGQVTAHRYPVERVT